MDLVTLQRQLLVATLVLVVVAVLVELEILAMQTGVVLEAVDYLLQLVVFLSHMAAVAVEVVLTELLVDLVVVVKLEIITTLVHQQESHSQVKRTLVVEEEEELEVQNPIELETLLDLVDLVLL